MQVDPIKPTLKATLKAPGIQHLKLKCDEPLSNFAFSFNLRCYIKGVTTGRKFANRSYLYRFNVAMDPGVQAARWCLSQEMSTMQGRVKDVCAVVGMACYHLTVCS